MSGNMTIETIRTQCDRFKDKMDDKDYHATLPDKYLRLAAAFGFKPVLKENVRRVARHVSHACHYITAVFSRSGTKTKWS